VARFFTSDLHFGHANIVTYSGRPFADVDAMNEGLVARWNAVVGDDDEVWILGDVALGPIEASLSLVARLRGHKVLVPGNHDRCWPGHGQRAEPWVERYLAAGLAEIRPGPVGTVVAGVEVRCDHFPYVGDSHDHDRYVEHRPVDEGHVILHGHVHGTWRAQGRQLNVGVDVWDYRPVAETTLAPLVLAAAAASPTG
jgi:calcineurin-like phosphoesterase family protein